MLFSVIFSLVIIFLSLLIDELIADFTISMEGTYGVNFIKSQAIFINSSEEQLMSFCPTTDMLLLFG